MPSTSAGWLILGLRLVVVVSAGAAVSGADIAGVARLGSMLKLPTVFSGMSSIGGTLLAVLSVVTSAVASGASAATLIGSLTTASG